MALDFPSSPTIGITTSIGNKTWEWTGSAWKLIPNVIAGIQGLQGVIGIQGVQGVQGVQATQGTQGLQGLQGDVGYQGVQGLSNQGVQGSRGFQGTEGPTGIQGLQGLQGLTGLYAGQGTQGIAGAGGGGGTVIEVQSDISDSTTNILFVADPTSPGIATLRTNPNLTFDASTSRIGIGTTTLPSFTVDVEGDVRVKSANKVRFGGTSGTTNYYIQYNSSTDSLDFISG